ncbi:MAG: HAMP domain-containing protein [Deltaproteobacteria bacterium]|nr:HAMP domain-containing protein [Deltaproteobacteria bacterium]
MSSLPHDGARPRWRRSLYSRAALYLLLGSASIVGAAFVVSSRMVEDSIERLLTERAHHARTIGVLLEDHLRRDLERLAAEVGTLLEEQPLRREALRRALEREYLGTTFGEGVFLLDPKGGLLAAVPAAAERSLPGPDVALLVQRARARGGAVNSHLVQSSASSAAVIVIVVPIKDRRGRPSGFLGGLLQPASTNLLQVLAGASGDTTGLDLVDDRGIHVASTDPARLFETGDHKQVLSAALRERRLMRSRCHSCHQEAGSRVERNTQVLAFAPLPTLTLGVAVHQPEADALRPAVTLRRRLMLVGAAFVSLFLLFAGLSVRGLVRPLTRLTRAVRRLRGSLEPAALPRFGDDEVGELAQALVLWHGRMRESLAAAEHHKRALRDEFERTRVQLDALEEIAAQLMGGRGLQDLAEQGLVSILRVFGLAAGALRVAYRERSWVAARAWPAQRPEEALARAESLLAGSSSSGTAALRILDAGEREALGLSGLRWGAVARLSTPQELELVLVLADPGEGPLVEERWLRSLLDQVAMAASHRLLRDADAARGLQQQQYLDGVLRAQEEERRRVARDLHDTIAQDLAALCLEVERLARRQADEQHRAPLEALEERLRGVQTGVRNIMLGLRLTLLETMGLAGTLQWHLERLEREHGLRCVFSVDGDEVKLPYQTAVLLFRITQEAVQNTVQHGHAQHAFVSLLFGEGFVEVLVEDDGDGFDPRALEREDPAPDGRGLGLLGIRERARLLGGTFELVSQVGEGTSVRVRVPLTGEKESATPR